MTGLPLKNFHKSRCWEANEDVVNAQVKQIEKQSAEEWWRFCWEALGLPANKYPGDKPIHFMYPDLDPDNQYHGSF